MGLMDRFKRDVPSTEEQLEARSAVDGIKHRDLQVVAQLIKMGADIKVPRHVIFYLYFPTEPTAWRAAQGLRADGIDASVELLPDEYLRENPDTPNPWRVKGESHDKALVPDYLRDTVDKCEELAAASGGEYAGWEAGLNVNEVGGRLGT